MCLYVFLPSVLQVQMELLLYSKSLKYIFILISFKSLLSMKISWFLAEINFFFSEIPGMIFKQLSKYEFFRKKWQYLIGLYILENLQKICSIWVIPERVFDKEFNSVNNIIRDTMQPLKLF